MRTSTLAYGTKLRSFCKAMSWRVIATTTTTLISYFITGSLKLSLSIGLIELVTKIGLYYLHERIWFFIL